MRRTTPSTLVGLFLVLAMIATACGGDDADSSSTTAATTETTTAATTETTTAATTETTAAAVATTVAGGPTTGGTLVYGAFEDLEAWDPEPTNSIPATTTIHSMVYEYLFEMASDGSGIVPGLADWAWSDDGLTMTVTIQEGAVFHDGSDLKSDDVVFSLERSQVGPNWGYAFEGMTFEATDDYTVVITLSSKYADLPAFLANWYAPIYPVDFGGMSEQEFFQAPIGSGAWKAVSWDPGEQVVLDRFDDFYGTKPYLDRVIWRVFTDPNSAVISYENGEVDALLNPPRDLIDSLPGIVVNGRLGAAMAYMTISEHGENLGDVHARKALLYAIDREAIRLAVFGEYSEPAVSVHGPVDLFPDLYAAADEPYTYDQERAREELELAGMPDGYTTSILYGVGSPENQAMAEIIKSQAAEVGIDITLKPLEGGAVGEARRNKEHDIFLNYIGGVILPTTGELAFYIGLLGISHGSYDTTDMMADCIDPILAESDPQLRQAGMLCFENWINDTASFHAMLHPHQIIVQHEDVHGMSFNKGTSFDAFEEVWKS